MCTKTLPGSCSVVNDAITPAGFPPSSAADILSDGTLGRPLLRSTVSPARETRPRKVLAALGVHSRAEGWDDTRMATPISKVQQGSRLVSASGGGLAILVSIGLLISLPMRGVGYNVLNIWTIVVASIAGWIAIRGGSRPDGAGLGWAVVLLLLAILPAVFGWVALLYLPALVLVFGAALHFITRPT